MLMRFDPFNDVDRVVGQLAGARAPRSFPMDAFRRGDEFIIELDLPGLSPDDIDINVEQNTLTIRAERRHDHREGDEIVVHERPAGTYSRQLLLGDMLDSERLEANYDQGVLRITIPVAEQAKPRRIQVGSRGGSPQTIEGTGGDRGQGQGGQQS